MVAKTYSFALWGIEAYLVEIEVDIHQGLPSINVVGLPDGAVKGKPGKGKGRAKKQRLCLSGGQNYRQFGSFLLKKRRFWL